MHEVVTRKFSKTDRLKSVKAFLKNPDGTAVDLTGKTLAFKLVLASDSSVKVNYASATVVTATTGEVKYDWAAADVDTAGDYWAWFRVTSGGLTDHFPAGQLFKIQIKDNV